MNSSYRKVLTKNDVGETGGHQAGITIPKKNSELLNFFPILDKKVFNPHVWITCVDSDGNEWDMRYIYYNGKTFHPKKSTRNEYRITYMTKFFRKWNANSEDLIVFKGTKRRNRFQVFIEKRQRDNSQSSTEPTLIVLKGWSKVY